MKHINGESCTFSKGKVVREWLTGDYECNAVSTEYQCGGVYNNNYMDILGNRDHDCFWDCSDCKYQKSADEGANDV